VHEPSNVHPSLRWCLDELGEQGLDPLIDLIDDGSHLIDREAGGVGELPVQVAFARIDRAGVAAAHGDDDVGRPGDLLADWLGEFLGGVETSFGQDGDDGGVQLIAWLGSGGADLDSAFGVVLEQDPGGGTATGVVGAEKENDWGVCHPDSLVVAVG
jgi:hypothetical protein